MAQPGRKPKTLALPNLRAVRQSRGWTADDLAAAVMDVAESSGEPAPGITGGQVSKWERGDRRPGPYYRARLCLALECTSEQLGLPATPSLSRSIRKLTEQRGEHAPVRASQPGITHAEMERIQATLTRLWPVDRPLLDGLDRVARHLGHRRDTEPPSAVLADLGGYLDVLIELLSRSQRSGHARDLRQIAAFVAQNLAMASWIARDAPTTYRTYALAETLAREARSGSQLSLILVDRSEMAGQTAGSPDDWEEALAMADAAETAALMDPATPPGVLAWIYGERSGHRAHLGNDLGSGRDLDRMEEVRLNSAPKGLNVFSPSLGGEWLDNYQVRRALRLGLGEDAIRLCGRILGETDRRLIWQQAETTILLAEAWLLNDELGAAAEKLETVIPLLTSTGNGRDLAAVRRIAGKLRKRWPRAIEVRRLDELLGYQRPC
jgi:transcriptional regulator with XRE-family HTH domain